MRQPFDEIVLKEYATGFHRPWSVDIHGILLAVVKHKKAVLIDNEAASVDDPLHLSVEDGFDRQRSGKVPDDMPPRASMEHEVVAAQADAVRKKSLRFLPRLPRHYLILTGENPKSLRTRLV
jgi:hypothetical protein